LATAAGRVTIDEKYMARIIHAQLDVETEKMLHEVERGLGWSDSEIVRAGIKMLRGVMLRRRSRPIVGIGRFPSVLSDLGSNKAHLKRFGR
jgi:hypothetical protein